MHFASPYPDAVEIRGADALELKEARLADFAAGKIRVLVTKPSIAGFWLEIGSIAPAWRSWASRIPSRPTTKPCGGAGGSARGARVEVHIFASEREGAVVATSAQGARRYGDGRCVVGRNARRCAINVLGSSRDSNPYIPSAKIIVPSFMEAA